MVPVIDDSMVEETSVPADLCDRSTTTASGDGVPGVIEEDFDEEET